MELNELTTIKNQLESALRHALPAHTYRVSIDYPDSPNPVCFFEVDGTFFAQGNFWANNEYRIEAMNTVEATEIMNESGTLETMSDAAAVIQRFCQLAKATPNS